MQVSDTKMLTCLELNVKMTCQGNKDRRSYLIISNHILSWICGALSTHPRDSTYPKLRKNAQTISTKLNFGSRKRFSENVRNLLRRMDVRGLDALVINSITKPVKAKVQVFHTSMMFRILGDTNGRLVVNVQSGRLFDCVPKFSK